MDIDELKFMRVTGELAKFGVKLKVGAATSMASRKDLFHDRAELRKGISEITAAAREAAKNGDRDLAEASMEAAETCADLIAGISRQLDLNEEAAEVWGGRNASADGAWLGPDGKKMQLLAPQQKLSELPHEGERPSFGFGELIRGMAFGTRNPDVRASLSEGSDSTGGVTVPEILRRDLIDLMRARTVTIRAGAKTVNLDTDKTVIARLASDPTASWRLENAAVATGDPSFEAVTFTARSLAVLVKVSRELLEDSVNLEQALMQAFAGSMAVATDRVALFGTGESPEPLGVYGTTGVGAVSMGTNGAAPTSYDPFLDLVASLQNANAADPSGIVISPRTATQLAKLKDTTNQPLRKPEQLATVPFLTTTQVPTDQTQGTATAASCAVCGDFSQMMIGVRSQLRIELLREAFATNLQYAFLAHLRMDVQLAHPQSFAVLNGIKAS
ncbi:MAG: phage major capsid protein [Gammaproteobacteria bacterium]